MKLANNQRRILTGSVVHFTDGQSVQVDQTPAQVREMLAPCVDDLVAFTYADVAVFIAGNRNVSAIVPTFDYTFGNA